MPYLNTLSEELPTVYKDRRRQHLQKQNKNKNGSKIYSINQPINKALIYLFYDGNITVLPSQNLLVLKQMQCRMLKNVFTFPSRVVQREVFPAYQVFFQGTVPQCLLPYINDLSRFQHELPFFIEWWKICGYCNVLSHGFLQAGDM